MNFEHILQVVEEHILAFFGLSIAGISIPAVIIFLFKFYFNKNRLTQVQHQSSEQMDAINQKLDLIFEEVNILNQNVSLSPGEKSKLRDISDRFYRIKYEIVRADKQAVAIEQVVNTGKEIVKTNGKTFIR